MAERAVFIKFGAHKHVLQLRDEGLLYMNNLPYFWEIEDNELRGDECDSVDNLHSGHAGKVGKYVIANWIIKELPIQPEKINIFCMYALRQDAAPIDKRNFRFGEQALIITNAQNFIDRIRSNLRDQGIIRKANLVKYVHDGYTGTIGPFRKRKMFAYQSEWRLVCYRGSGEVRKIRMGSIRDISFILPSDETNSWAEQEKFIQNP